MASIKTPDIRKVPEVKSILIIGLIIKLSYYQNEGVGSIYNYESIDLYEKK